MSVESRRSEAPMGGRSGSGARIVFGALLLPWSFGLVVLACGGADSSVVDGHAASRDPVGADSAASPARADSSNAPDSSSPLNDGGGDADALAPSHGPGGAGLVACGSETCTAFTQACTGVLHLVLPGLEDAAVSDASACQPYPLSSFISVTCDDPTDCPLPGRCIVTGQGLTIANPAWADAGLSILGSLCRTDPDSVTLATSAQPASFQLRTCGDAAPCPAGQVCHRQTCEGFAFDLCGDIPPGACGR